MRLAILLLSLGSFFFLVPVDNEIRAQGCSVSGGCTPQGSPCETCKCDFRICGLPAHTKVRLWLCTCAPSNSGCVCYWGAYRGEKTTDGVGCVDDHPAGGCGWIVTSCYTVGYEDEHGTVVIVNCCTNESCPA